jgi:hypothetical protein
MAEFLAANPRDVIVIGMSNINCGDKEQTRQQLLQVRTAHCKLSSSSAMLLSAAEVQQSGSTGWSANP